MAVQWTEAQQSAIDARGRNVLVCAAAGSGKTATLTERIIRRLTDEKAPSDISRMLVVTYTRNAAAELKEKIYKALSVAIEADPTNKFLSMQMMKLPAARISTIHSFCFEIVKRNTARLGLPSSLRNESAPEAELRARRVMDEVVSDFYDSAADAGKAAEFARLAESITDAKNEGSLSEIFLNLYKKLCSYRGGARTLKQSAYDAVGSCKGDFFDSTYGAVYKQKLSSCLSAYRERFDKMITMLSEEDNDHPYLPALFSDRDMTDAVILDIDRGYTASARHFKDVKFKSLGSVKREDVTELSELARALHTNFKNDITKNFAPIFEYSSDEIEYATARTEALSLTLADVLCEYEERFRKDKLEAGVLDYNDLEYYAEQVLYDGDAPSDAARDIAALTDEIYIDEYQDVNEVQDRIFTAVSNGHNLFMVGDVKQSIYAFRGGEPSIFISRRDSYPDYAGDECEQESCSIFMQNNFRCDSKVVSFVNTIFATLLGEAHGRFKYIPEDELVYSKDNGIVSDREVYPRVVLCVDDEENTDRYFHSQAAFVAEEIVRLLEGECKNDGSPIRPDDIAILVRSDKSNAAIYKRELERRGIAVSTGDKTPFYESAEVKLALCILNAIDNPHRDVYLAGALLSCIYRFTTDELAIIKHEYRDSISLYDAIKRYASEHDDEKCKRFIFENDRLRNMSKNISTDALIWYIYEQSFFISVVSADSHSIYDKRKIKKNCMALYDCARDFEQGGFRGLYSFIEYMESMMAGGLSLDGEKEYPEGCVKIMSMHGSKGLEFPVCFVCETQTKFSQKDITPRLLYEKDIGVGLKLRESGSLAVVETPHRTAIAQYKRRAMREEEMRILYVALTRARERLYITASSSGRTTVEKMLEKASYNAELFSQNTVAEINNFADAILLCMKRTPMPVPCEIVSVSDRIVSMYKGETKEIKDVKTADADDTEALYSLLSERMEYEYPYSELTKIKAKMSVSKLYPGVLDEDDTDASDTERVGVSLTSSPDFLKSERSPDAAARGTATHLIMQFADFDKMSMSGVDSELERLVAEGFIDSFSAEIANREHIETFLKSGFFSRLRSADRLWREFRFNLDLDAASFTEDKERARLLEGEKLLVQGVIDGFFSEGENIVLFDYKTDHLTEYEMLHPELAEKKLTERHSQQLSYYKTALERIFGHEVREVYIYSLPLGREIRVDIK